MSRRSGNRCALRGVCAIVFMLCLSLLAPGAAIAAQPEAATPISAEPIAPEDSLATSEDGDVSAAAINAAFFNEPVYFVGPAESTTATLYIQMGGIDPGGTFTFGFSPPTADFALQSPVATPGTSGVTCDVSTSLGVISGSFSNTEIGPGACEISFTIANVSLLPVALGASISGTVTYGDASNLPVFTTVASPLIVAEQVTGDFDQEVYTATVGESFPMSVTLDVPTGALVGSTATLPLFVGLLSYDNVTASAGGGATCSATNVPATGVNVSFSNMSGGPGTCTVSLTATMLSWPGDGVQIFLVMGVLPLGVASLPIQTSLIGYTQSSGSLTLSLDPPSVLAGDQVTVTVSQSQPVIVVGDNRMQVLFPDGVTGVPGSGTVTCAPIDCPGSVVTVGPDSVLATYTSLLAGTSATLTFDVVVDDDVVVPATLEFTANGELGTGPLAQRTGPKTSILEVLEALATGDQNLTVDYRGSVDGIIAASGGTPDYTFAVQDAPSLGAVDLDSATGAFTYTANDLATGPDSFTVLVTDSGMPSPQSVLATVNVDISEPAPLAASPLELTVAPGETVTGDLASQVSGGMPPYTFSVLDQPAQGSVTIDPDGSFTYQANDDADGTDSFTYTVTDSELQPTGVNATASTTGEVTIDFAAIPSTATATATLPDGSTPPAGATATATVDRQIPPPRPTQTATPTAESGGGSGGGTGDGSGGGTGVTALPSTGAGADTTGSMLLLLLAGVLLLLAGSVSLARRR